MPSTPTTPHYLPLLLAVWLTPLPPDRSPSSPKGSQGYLPFPPYSPGSHWHLSHVFGTWWQYLTILGTVSCLYRRTLFYMAVFFKALHVHNTVQKVGPNLVTRGEASNLFPTKETLSFCHLWLILKLQTVLGTPQIPPPPESVHKVINLIPNSGPLLVGLPCACFEARRICFQKTKKKVGQE